MLVVTRKTDESIVIDVQGTPIYVHILHTARGGASVGIDAPREWGIRRTELPPYLGGTVKLQQPGNQI
jgi:carbon storage regulator CsrA